MWKPENRLLPTVRQDRLTHEVEFNARLRAFAKHWGFRPRACIPYRARTKATDERGVYSFNDLQLGAYKLPTVGDMPKIHLAFADSYEPTGPFGAKGVGEIALDAVPAAIANAVHDAVGVRITELPITAEKVYRAMREREAHS